MVELIYWPMVQVLTWGLIQIYVAQHSGFFARAGATLIGAMLLWEILFRGQLGFSVSFLEEMWARNLGNLMMSPLRPAEFVAALMVMSLLRLVIGMVPVFIVALAFFGFNVYHLGFAFVFFFVNLILTSWSIGILVSGLLLRHGHGRGKPGLDACLPDPAALLRLLPRERIARMAATFFLAAAAHLRV